MSPISLGQRGVLPRRPNWQNETMHAVIGVLTKGHCVVVHLLPTVTIVHFCAG